MDAAAQNDPSLDLSPGDPDDLLAVELAKGKSWEDAAKSVGVSRSTVKRRMQSQAFRTRVAEFRREAVQRALSLLAEGMPDAAALLHMAVSDESQPPTARVQAAKLLIEMMLKVRGQEDLADQVAELRAKVAELTGRSEPA